MQQSDADLSMLIQVDEICEEYEAVFRRGDTPQIENYLDRVAPVHRSTLIRELVALDVGLRYRCHDPLSTDELVRRYAPLLPAESDPEIVLRPAIEKALASTEHQTDSAVASTMAHDPRASTGERIPASGFPKVSGFEIESVLGRGGMGIVFKAMQTFPRRPVALKMILDNRLSSDRESQEFFARFSKEAQAVADLNDPHFVQIYAFGEADGRPYMALEYVDGGSLETYRRGEPHEESFAARMVEQLARGMYKCHRAGLVHRDLKPHNVLLTPAGLPKIADFGLAKRLDQDAQLTDDGRPLGTPSYMAPEQTYGTRDVGPAADIYALGGILYCLLTGRPPFQATNWRDTFDQVCHQDPVPPSQLNPKTSRDLETICLKCLQKEPARRYATAEELAEDLRCFQEGHPILARPISRGERAWRWARRNPLVAALSSGVAFLVLTVAIVSSAMSWQLSRKNDEISQQNVEITQKSQLISDQNEMLQEKNSQLTAARNATQQQRNSSLDVVRNVVLSVDDLLRDNAALFRLRGQLIEQALRGLDAVRDSVDKNPLSDVGDPLVERTEAIAYQRMGEMYLRGNRVTDAAHAFERAFEILDRLAKAAPGDPVHIRNLAAILNSRGDAFLRLGRTREAADVYEQSRSLRERWSQLLPEHHDARRAIAESHGLLGKVSMMLGEPETALAHFLSAKAIGESLPAPPTAADAMKLRRERAANEQRLGDASYQLGNTADAEQHYQVALQLRQDAARDGKDHPLLRHDVALSRMSLGNLYLLAADDPGKAWEQYNEALRIFLALMRDQPGSHQARRDLAAVQYRFGATFRRAREKQVKLPNGDDPPDPASHFEAARTLRESLAQIDPQDVQAKIEWALAAARCGQAAEAEKLALDLAKSARSGHDPWVLFQVACTFALCSETEDGELASRCCEQAFAILDELIAAGWKDRVALKNDPDLAPLREDPRFIKFDSS